MPAYKPRIADRDLGPEQRFDANILAIEEMEGGTLVAFGDLVPKEGAPLNRGTPVHSLIFQLFDGDLTVELNDQGNQRSGGEVERLELSPSSFRVVFRLGEGPYSGRVSLSSALELFDGAGDEEPVQLRSVMVGLAGVAAQAKRLRRALRKNPSTASVLVEVDDEEG